MEVRISKGEEMKKLLSVVLLISSMRSYAGYIIPDTRDNEIHFNNTTSASSFRKIKFGALSRGVNNSTTEKNDGSDDEDQTLTGDSLMGRTHMDKITLEGLIAKNSYSFLLAYKF